MAVIITAMSCYRFDISNFLERPEINGQSFMSPNFNIRDKNGKVGNCALKIFPKGSTVENKEKISVYLCKTSSTELNLSYYVSLKDKDGKQVLLSKNHEGNPPTRDFSLTHLKRNVNKLLPNGVLSLILEIKKPFLKPEPESDVPKILEDFMHSFKTMEYTDVKIICNGETFNCHRFMLSSRSKYFLAMLKDGYKESINKEINMDSMEPDILKEMLSFIYSGQINNLDDRAVELFKAGDQYQIDDLKEACGVHLIGKLNLDNVLNTLALADRHNDKILKESSIKFMVKNIKTLMDTTAWKEMNRENPDLFVEVMASVIRERVA